MATASKTEQTVSAPAAAPPSAAAAPASTSTSTEVQKPAQAPPEAPVLPELKNIETVHGDMVDPLTGLTYSRKPQELLKRTGWVDAQIAAGKMKMVK